MKTLYEKSRDKINSKLKLIEKQKFFRTEIQTKNVKIHLQKSLYKNLKTPKSLYKNLKLQNPYPNFFQPKSKFPIQKSQNPIPSP